MNPHTPSVNSPIGTAFPIAFASGQIFQKCLDNPRIASNVLLPDNFDHGDRHDDIRRCPNRTTLGAIPMREHLRS